MAKKLKNEILNNLTGWCLDSFGDLVKADLLKNRVYKDVNAYWFRFHRDDESNPNWRNEPSYDEFDESVLALDSRHYQEIKEAMIEEIKQNPRDWKIEKEMEFTVIRNNKTGRKHWKSDFSEGFKKGFKPEEWAEIENALNNKFPNEELSSQNQNTKPEKSNEHQKKLFIKVIFISLLASLLFISFMWWLKSCKKNKTW